MSGGVPLTAALPHRAHRVVSMRTMLFSPHVYTRVRCEPFDILPSWGYCSRGDELDSYTRGGDHHVPDAKALEFLGAKVHLHPRRLPEGSLEGVQCSIATGHIEGQVVEPDRRTAVVRRSSCCRLPQGDHSSIVGDEDCGIGLRGGGAAREWNGEG